MSNPNVDVAVIGAGVLGTFHAWTALERGYRVCLIERHPRPRGASLRNFGMIVRSALAAGVWLERANHSAAVYRRLADELGFHLNTQGTFYLAHTEAEAAVLQEFAASDAVTGHACRLLDSHEAATCHPAVRREHCRAALYFPGDLRFDPAEFFESFLRRIERHPECLMRFGTPAVAVEDRPGGVAVRLADGTRIEARQVFVCTGGDFSILFPRAFGESGLVPCRLHMMRLRPPEPWPELPSLASHWTLRRYASFYKCNGYEALLREPLADDVERYGIHVLMAFGADGRIVLGDSHEYGAAAAGFEFQTAIETALLREANDMVSQPLGTIVERWLGWYTLHPAADLFRMTIGERVHVVTGVGGKGMTTAPALAAESMAVLAGP